MPDNPTHSRAQRSGTLRHLRRKVRPRPLLFLSNCPLFKEVRRSLQGPPGGRPQMVMAISSRLTITPRVSAFATRAGLKK